MKVTDKKNLIKCSMKKQIYIVEIDMPDGDFVSSGWLQDLIQQDLDSEEDKNRQTVSVREISLPSDLDEAAEEYRDTEVCTGSDYIDDDGDSVYRSFALKEAFKAGAEWMAGKYEKIEGELVDWYSTSDGKDYCCGVKTIDSFEAPEGFYIRKK